MKPFCRFALTISTLVAITALAELPAQGKGRGGGGGGGKEPLAGTVYFSFDGSTWTMDPDGTNKTRLSAGVAGEPSYALHGGKRWFLTVQGGELRAVNDGGGFVPLTDPADGVSLGLVRWAKDDPSTTTVDEADSFVGYVGADSGGITSIYRMPLSWPLDAPAPAGPPVAVLPNIASGVQITFDWSPDGDQLVYEIGVQGSVELRVVDVISAESRVLVTGGNPRWSPDGATILFSHFDKTYLIRTIRPDGTGSKTILQGHGGKLLAVVQPRWSPASTHLVYLRTGAGGGEDPDIFRATSSGGSKTNLTKELVTFFLGRLVTPVGWR